MTTRQLLAAGGSAVALLLGASLLLLYRLDEAGRRLAPAAGAAPLADPRSVGPDPGPFFLPAAPPAGASPGTPSRPQAFQPSVRGLPSASDQAAWQDVPLAVKLADLGPLAAPVSAGLEAARRDMDGCFQAEAAAPEPAAAPGADVEPPTGPATLVLRLESRERGLDVAGAEAESLGTSSKALVACCQKVLQGWSIPADAAQPGRRYRLKYLLQ